MNKKIITPLVLIGLLGIAYYGYTKGWFTKKLPKNDVDSDNSTTKKAEEPIEPTNKIDQPRIGANPVNKIGFKRIGAN